MAIASELKKLRNETIGTIAKNFRAGGFRDPASLEMLKKVLGVMTEGEELDPEFAQNLYNAAVMQNVFGSRRPEPPITNISPLASEAEVILPV